MGSVRGEGAEERWKQWNIEEAESGRETRAQLSRPVEVSVTSRLKSWVVMAEVLGKRPSRVTKRILLILMHQNC